MKGTGIGGRFVFTVKVIPKARADKIDGMRNGSLLVRVKSAPEHGKANESVRDLLAAALGIPSSSVAIEKGLSSRGKSVSVPESSRSAYESLLLKSAGP